MIVEPTVVILTVSMIDRTDNLVEVVSLGWAIII